MSDSFIRLEDICITYRQKDVEQQIVDNLNLSISSGQVVVLSGRSGSGKSSLLNICYGFQKPSAGKMFWFGDDVAAMSEKKRQRVRRERFGVCSQEVQVFDSHTALQNVLLGGAAREAAVECLGLLGLGERVGSPVRVMSGGERQRVQVARAVAKNPDVLVLDEPTSALDINAARAVAGLIQDAKNRGAAVVLGTHDEVLLEIADEVIKL